MNIGGVYSTRKTKMAHVLTVLTITLLTIYSEATIAGIDYVPSTVDEHHCAVLKLNTLTWPYFQNVLLMYSRINNRSLSIEAQTGAAFKGIYIDMGVADKIKRIYSRKLAEIGISLSGSLIPNAGEGALRFRIHTEYIGPSPSDKHEYAIEHELVLYEHVKTDMGHSKWSELLRIVASDLTSSQWLEDVATRQVDQLVSELAKLRLKAFEKCRKLSPN